METLRILIGTENVEVYSVDECFITLENITQKNLDELALQTRLTVEEWTGIKVSVGIAPTKLLAKVANKLAKKNKAATQCVMVLDTKEKITDALKKTKVADVWGIGYQYTEKADVFSFGIILWEIASREPPYRSTPPN